MECVICQTPGAELERWEEGWFGTCRRCGVFGVTNEALQSLDEDSRWNVSGWIRDQNRLGETQVDIDLARLTRMLQLSPPPISERPARLIREVVSAISALTDNVPWDDPRLLAAIYAKNPAELAQVKRYLHGEGLLRQRASGADQLTLKGLIFAETRLQKRSKSIQGFVAMWFDEEMIPAWNDGFEPAIRVSGFEPFRVDRHEHVNRIDDEIISQIRRSRFLVADFTKHRGGVYFEAGFALGLDLPVIWTCRDDDLEALHFDTRQYNFIAWREPEDLRTRLQQRIEAIVGLGRLE